MMVIKAVHTTTFTTTNHMKYGYFHNKSRPINTKSSKLCLCSKSDDTSSSDSEAPSPEGDANKQELLAKIAMLQAEKVRLTDYLDETSSYLTQFAEEANTEFDKIGEDALKGLDEASARITENIETQMQAFQESAEMNRMEIERNENKLADFEGQIERDRNEGMFFQSLGQRAPTDKAKAKKEAEKIKDLTKAKAGSKTRKNIYLALTAIIAASIAESFIAASADWRKVAVLGAILVGLITQYSYEQRLSSDIERMEKETLDSEKK